MIKRIVAQSESVPFSLYLIEKDGQPIIVRSWAKGWGFNFETREESARPTFEIIEPENTMADADLESFVQAVISGNHRSHPLSEEFRIERDRQRTLQCEAGEEEKRMRGRH